MKSIKNMRSYWNRYRFIRSHWRLILLILIFVVGLAFVVSGAFKLQGPALISFLIIGVLLIMFSSIRLVIDSIGKSAIEREETKQLREKLERSEETRKRLEEKLKEDQQKPLKILDVHPILDMGMLEVDFALSKFFDQQYIKNKNGSLERVSVSPERKRGDFRFIGGLTAKFKARYGIDLRAMKVKEDPVAKRFYVSGANPMFLGTSDFPDIHWEGSVLLGYNLTGRCWETDDLYAKNESACREGFLKGFQEKLKSGPEELNCFKTPLQEYIRRLIQVIFAPRGHSVELVDIAAAKDFLPFRDYLPGQGIRALETNGWAGQ